MDDAYNQAIKYLRQKYNNDNIERIKKYLIDNDFDMEICLLIQQYYYGIDAKKQLSAIMKNLF